MMAYLAMMAVRLIELHRVLATLNNVVLALVDRIGVANLAAQQRIFDAHPDQALNLILHPI